MKNIYGLLTVAAVAVAMASTASAAPIACAPGVTDVTMIGAQGCSVAGDPGVVFSNFVVSVTGASSAIVGIASASYSNGDIDLTFQISLGVETIPETADLLLSYTVTGGIDGIDDTFTGTPIPGSGGYVRIIEQACSTPFTQSLSQCLPSADLLANYSGQSTGAPVSDMATFPGGATVSPVYIKKDISFASAAMSEFDNSQLTGVPEPMTFSLIGAGLLGLGFMGRRLRR